MQGSTGDQGPKLGSREPKMRQNHPETSTIPPHSNTKHIPKLFFRVIFHPKSLQNRSVPKPPLQATRQNLPCKTAKTATGPSCAILKPVCGGLCGRPNAWMPPTVSQDTVQSLWDPTLGSPGHPGSVKTRIVKNSPFSSQICLAKLPKAPRDHLVRPQNP